MDNGTIGSMLDSAKDFEAVLEKYLAGIRDQATDDNTRLLTYYLARLKRNLPKTLEMFPAEKLEQIRKMPLKEIDSEFVAERVFDGQEVSSNVKAPELLEKAIELIEVLICFYQWLLTQPEDITARDVIKELVRNEEESLANLKKLRFSL